jgi:hypothetical protein
LIDDDNGGAGTDLSHLLAEQESKVCFSLALIGVWVVKLVHK